MRILLSHNFYQQAGGEDRVFAFEGQLLEEAGHEVLRVRKSNDEIRTESFGDQLSAAAATIWSRSSFSEYSRLVADFRPDVAHFHNVFPLISPSAFAACSRAGVPVVQTLHNFRLVCAGATLFRDGRVCEDCLGRTFGWPALQHACYRSSRLGSTVVAAMGALHRSAGTWDRHVDLFVALTEFHKKKLAAGGLDARRMVVKANSVAPSSVVRSEPGSYFLFAGRLGAEKGLDVLLRAWRGLDMPLHIAGAGELEPAVVEAARNNPSIRFLGWIDADEMSRQLLGARALVVPSSWYEAFPINILEAMAVGLPTVASRLGSLAEIIDDGRTGRLFAAGDDAALRSLVEELWRDGDQSLRLGQAARDNAAARFSAQANLASLESVYAQATALRSARRGTA